MAAAAILNFCTKAITQPPMLEVVVVVVVVVYKVTVQ